LLGFAGVAIWGRLARACAAAIRDAAAGPAATPVTDDLARALDFVEVLLGLNYQRIVSLRPPTAPPLVIASDARADEHGPPSLAVLLWDPVDDARLGLFLVLGPDVLRAWGDLAQPIAVAEGAAVPAAQTAWPQRLAGRDVWWWIDNAVALAAFTKGGSKEAALDRAAAAVGLLNHRSHTRMWFEFVASADNWADEASRLGPAGPWAARRNSVFTEAAFLCAFGMPLGLRWCSRWQAGRRKLRGRAYARARTSVARPSPPF